MTARKPRTLLLSCTYYHLERAPVEYLPPVHLLYIGTFLRERGYPVQLFDILSEFGVQHDQADIDAFLPALRRGLEALEGDYQVVGISCYTSLQYLPSLDLARLIRQVFPKALIVVGGYHPTAVAGDFLFPGSPFDCVVQGEGETAMLAILEQAELGDKPPPIFSTAPVLDINQLPPLDYSFIEDWGRYSYYYDYLSRGCPFSCRFCMEASMPERRWRGLSPENALERIDRAQAVLGKTLLEPSGLFMLNDPLFGGKRSWLKEVLGRMAQKPRPYGFFASPRVDVLDTECLRLFAKAGFSIDLPVEHGSAEQLLRMQKTRDPQRFLAQGKALAAEAHALGLPFHTHWVMGHPGETPDTLRECLAYMESMHQGNDQGMTEIFYFKLYPGSWLSGNWVQVEREWGAREEVAEYWKLNFGLDHMPYHIQPSSRLSRLELMEWVEARMKPAGEAINRHAIAQHDQCCGRLRKENAPWIL